MNNKRRKATVLVVAACLLHACERPTSPQEKDSPAEAAAEKSLAKLANEDVEIIEIEGCEYVVYTHTASANQGFGFMAHKGNCKNPIHTCRAPDRAQESPSAEEAEPSSGR